MANFKNQLALNQLVTDVFSDWSNELEVTQEMIDAFAQVSGDKLWIHTDPERCEKHSPFGSTIAHGFLTLSLLSQLRTASDISQDITGYSQIMNYGSDKLRFMAPVPVNSRIHARCRVSEIVVGEKKTKATIQWQVYVVGQETPSLVYHMTLVFI